MSFGMYVFCQNTRITVFTAAYGALIMAMYFFDLPILTSALIAMACSAAFYIPVVALFYPLLVAVYLGLGIWGTYDDMNVHFILCVVMEVIYLFRLVAMLTFIKRDPQQAKEYNEMMRKGHR